MALEKKVVILLNASIAGLWILHADKTRKTYGFLCQLGAIAISSCSVLSASPLRLSFQEIVSSLGRQGRIGLSKTSGQEA